MRTVVLFLVATLAGTAAASAQEKADGRAALDALVAENRYEIALEDGDLTGAGAVWITGEAAAAHFFLFGEQHAAADIADAATSLIRILGPLGYRRTAVEVGPWSTPRLEALLRDGDAFERYLRQEGRSLTFPFFFFAEEAAFGRAAIAASGRAGGALWGVDQEFIAGAFPVLDRLDELATSEAQRRAIADARERAAAEPMLLGGGDGAVWATLTEAFADGGVPEARRLLADVEVSRRIYSPFVGRGGNVFDANQEREGYMKRWFAHHLSGAERRGETPRVFLKFGANHLFYGHSPTRVLTLGTFVREQAFERGLTTFSLHVDCRGGEVRDPLSGDAKPCLSYFLKHGSDLSRYLFDDRPTLIDLRPLRRDRSLFDSLDEISRRLVLAYDAYLALPDVAAATLVR